MDKEDIGSSIAEGLGAPAAAAPVAETPAASPATPAAAPAETAPATPETPAAAAASPAAVPAATETGKQESVPLPTFLDMRDENKRLKAELAKANEAKPAAPVTPPPSFKDDPEGFAAHLAEQTTRTQISTRFEVSELNAREKHGDDIVSSAMEWGMQRAQESPAFAAEYLKQPNPIAWAVKQHKRAALLDEIGDDEEKFITARAEKLGFVKASPAAAPAAPSTPQAAAPATPQPAPQATPTRSLASAPSAGGPAIVPSGPLAAFERLTPT